VSYREAHTYLQDLLLLKKPQNTKYGTERRRCLLYRLHVNYLAFSPRSSKQAEPWGGTHDWKTQGKTSTHCWGTVNSTCVAGSTSVTFLNWLLTPCGGATGGTCFEAEVEIWTLTHSSGPPTNVGMSLHKNRSSPIWIASGKLTRVVFNASGSIDWLAYWCWVYLETWTCHQFVGVLRDQNLLFIFHSQPCVKRNLEDA
jgi:hypothetical protein